MKTQSLNTKITALMSVLIAAIILMSCSKDADVLTPSSYDANDGTSTWFSAEEQSDLQFMVEKEKLLKNVYQVMYDTYDNYLFKTIMDCKEKHMTLLSARLDKYGLENPVAYLGDGVFSNSSFQQIYDTFIEEGQIDLTESMMYLKNMEEKHIIDIENTLSKTEGNLDVVKVYNICLVESKAHLDEILIFTKGMDLTKKLFDPIREL